MELVLTDYAAMTSPKRLLERLGTHPYLSPAGRRLFGLRVFYNVEQRETVIRGPLAAIRALAEESR